MQRIITSEAEKRGFSLLTGSSIVNVLQSSHSSSMLDRWSIRGLLEGNSSSAHDAGAGERDAAPAADTTITVTVITTFC